MSSLTEQLSAGETAGSLVSRTAAWFSDSGPLQTAVENYSPRDAQASMATAVARAMLQRSSLIVEAGTGTGKSLAYLVPAMLSAGKVIVSTGTKNLQDQLFNKDIPLLLKLVRHPVRVSLLKGRANYLCLHRLKLAQADPALMHRRSGHNPWVSLQNLREWGVRSPDGDLNAGDSPTLDAIPLSRVTSTAENCLGTECPEFSDCFVVKARRRAQEADLVVVNHHLLLADLALREEGFAELLPQADAVILDEAHQLPQVASQFFGARYSYYQLADLARDLRAEIRDAAGDMPGLGHTLGDYEQACAAFGQAVLVRNGREPWAEVGAEARVSQCFLQLEASLGELESAMEDARVRSKGLEQLARRIKELSRFLAELQAEGSDVIRWVERGERNFVIHLTPLDVADNFRQIMQSTPAAWVMTSATLSVEHGFRHFAAQVGADSADELILESPFDFASNALLYLPDIAVEPNHPRYLEAVAQAILPVIAASGGGAFVLCTSLQAVDYLAGYLRQQLEQQIMVQGESSRHLLLESFRNDGNAVLVGTSSFWEGVDVRGPALRLVIIDRLPFAHPGDPILRARLEAIRQQEGNPFQDYQVPQAVIALKQGVGRLIRDTDDRGVVMICDPRIRRRGYGRSFLDSLPAMGRTQDFQKVRQFIEQECAA